MTEPSSRELQRTYLKDVCDWSALAFSKFEVDPRKLEAGVTIEEQRVLHLYKCSKGMSTDGADNLHPKHMHAAFVDDAVEREYTGVFVEKLIDDLVTIDLTNSYQRMTH